MTSLKRKSNLSHWRNKWPQLKQKRGKRPLSAVSLKRPTMHIQRKWSGPVNWRKNMLIWLSAWHMQQNLRSPQMACRLIQKPCWFNKRNSWWTSMTCWRPHWKLQSEGNVTYIKNWWSYGFGLHKRLVRDLQGQKNQMWPSPQRQMMKLPKSYWQKKLCNMPKKRKRKIKSVQNWKLLHKLWNKPRKNKKKKLWKRKRKKKNGKRSCWLKKWLWKRPRKMQPKDCWKKKLWKRRLKQRSNKRGC